MKQEIYSSVCPRGEWNEECKMNEKGGRTGKKSCAGKWRIRNRKRERKDEWNNDRKEREMRRRRGKGGDEGPALNLCVFTQMLKISLFTFIRRRDFKGPLLKTLPIARLEGVLQNISGANRCCCCPATAHSVGKGTALPHQETVSQQPLCDHSWSSVQMTHRVRWDVTYVCFQPVKIWGAQLKKDPMIKEGLGKGGLLLRSIGRILNTRVVLW